MPPTRPTPRTRRAGGARRIVVLDAVMDVLAERGYESTRFTDVAAASGVAVSTLQTYFGSREDMLIEAMRRATDLEVTALEAVGASEDEPWKRLVALVDRNLRNSARTQHMLFEFWRSGLRDEELRAYGEDARNRYAEPFVRTVAEGRDSGAFHPVHSPEDVVDFLLAALAGDMIARMLRVSGTSAPDFRQVLLTQIATALGLDPGQAPTTSAVPG